jgi:RNA polymerase sigma-70 factor (ECF subfamily)
LADEGLEGLGLREQQLDALERCLNKLPDDRKQLVMRIYAADQPIKTIAKQIGKTPNAAYQILSRARRDLLTCVEQTLAAEEAS